MTRLLLTDMQLGYLTGIIAGEGMIGLFTRGGTDLAAKVEVFNTEPSMLYDLKNMTGLGKVYLNVKARSVKHRRSLFWRVQGYEVVPLLDAIIPSLTHFNSAKAEQARLVRAYCILHMRDYRNGRAGMTKKLCPCELALRQSYVKAISDLKHVPYLCDI